MRIEGLELMQAASANTGHDHYYEGGDNGGGFVTPQTRSSSATTTTTTTTVMMNGRRIVVTYDNRKGYLSVSFEYLCFTQRGGDNSNRAMIEKKWQWSNLDQVTVTVNAIIFWDTINKKEIHFQLETEEISRTIAADFRSRIRQARFGDPSKSPPSSSYNQQQHNASGVATPPTSDNTVVSSIRSVGTMAPEELENLVNQLVEKRLQQKEKEQEEKTQAARRGGGSMEEKHHNNHIELLSTTGRDSSIQGIQSCPESTAKTENVTSISLPSSEKDQQQQQQEEQYKEESNDVILTTCMEGAPTLEDFEDEHHDVYDHLMDDSNVKQKLGRGRRRGGGGIIELARSRANYGDSDEWHSPFGESTFTLLYMHHYQSQAFWYGIFIYTLQMWTIILTMVDIIDEGASENPLRIPPMVEMSVTLGQTIAIFMSQALQSDLIEAVIKLQDGFYPEVLAIHPGATYQTWLFSCLAQLVSGLLLLAISFILTMQGSSVVELMLNMTALLFMAEIDDISFAMAKMGFIRTQLQRECQAVVDFRVPKRKSQNKERRILYVVFLIGMFAGYGILKHRQLNGYYLQANVYVQFGDEYNPKLPYFSGTLSSKSLMTTQHREYRDGTENILLAYCTEKKAWTFSEVNNPCDYFAISSETRSHDVTSIPDWEWFVKDEHERLHPFQSFSLVGRDCHHNPEVCQGTCVNKLCECPHDRFGLDCEFSVEVDICQHLLVDGRHFDFPTVHQHGKSEEYVFGVSTEYELLRNHNTQEYVKVYAMPVYYSNKTYPANIIFYAGRRWIVTSEWDLFNLTEAEMEHPDRHFFPERTVATMENGFHGYYQADYTPLFISDPVDYETPDFKPTPSGLGWWEVKETKGHDRHYEPDFYVWTYLTCKLEACTEQPEDFCGHRGKCNEVSGICECEQSYFGQTCELRDACYEQSWPCNGRGMCDESSEGGWCRCDLPYHGKFCELHYKCYEEEGRCRNGGICNMTTGLCDCQDPATSGVACEMRADCLVFGCENQGYCVALTGRCVCRPPFHGPLCNLVDTTDFESALGLYFCAKDDDCVSGRCDTETGICSCADPASYGTLCEHQFNCTHQISKFSDIPCLNGGTCNETTSVCECPDPYFGPDCSQVPRCQNDDDCGPGYYDVCDVESGNCKCDSGWTAGKMCEKGYGATLCSVDADCHHGGVCTSRGCDCHSTDDYAGPLCDFVFKEDDPQDHDFLILKWYQEEQEQRVQCCGFDDPVCNDPTCYPPA